MRARFHIQSLVYISLPRQYARDQAIHHGSIDHLLSLAFGFARQLGLLPLLLLCCLSKPALAWELAGTKTIAMQVQSAQATESIKLGTVTFEPQADGTFTFKLTMDREKYTDHFLSMKEFKCVPGPRELMCHVPYPYAQPSTVTRSDFAWLEHALLFMFKLPNEFGAKLWNGLYFQLSLTDQGLLGKPQAIDLNAISAPPDKLNIPPYRPALRDDIPHGSRWVTGLWIQ
jgi:hypothetical protein